MTKQLMKLFGLIFLCMLPAGVALAGDALLKLPNFKDLEKKANNVVVITLDEKLLGLATRFLDPGNADDNAVRDIVAGLHGVYVRSYKFDTDFAYPKTDVDAVRKQLQSPGWQQLVQVRSRKEQADVDVYLMNDGNNVSGLAIISSQPREFTIVNIVGSIDLDKLHRLEGQFGIPKLELERKTTK